MIVDIDKDTHLEFVKELARYQSRKRGKGKVAVEEKKKSCIEEDDKKTKPVEELSYPELHEEKLPVEKLEIKEEINRQAD